jgi:hypothetical protein
MKTLLVAIVASWVLAAPAGAQGVDLTGDWVFEVKTDFGTGSPTFAFKQEGEKLTGTYKGMLGEAPVQGTVSGKTFRFTFTGHAQGSKVTVTYDGEAETSDSVKGKLDLGGMGSGTFTGKRKK